MWQGMADSSAEAAAAAVSAPLGPATPATAPLSTEPGPQVKER